MRTLFRVTRNILIVLLGLYLLLFSATRVIHFPEPVKAVRLALASASQTPSLMPSHIVTGAGKSIPWQMNVRTLPKTVNWNGQDVSVTEFLTRTKTNAFLIVRNGAIAYEWYKRPALRNTLLPSYSVAKSLTAIMIGKLIDEGILKENDTFVKYFPKYRTSGDFDKITIQELLDMQSGLDLPDNYPSGWSGWANPISQMYATTDLTYFLKNNLKMKADRWITTEYKSIDTQLLGLIIKKVTGTGVADYFSKKVWQPIGAEQNATWNVDHKGGVEKTFCCFNATARDYARVGQLLLDGGINKATGAVVISPSWLNRLTTPTSTLIHGWGYGAQMWHPFEDVDLMAGLHGQYVYIQPSKSIVIVKLSDEPTYSEGSDASTPYVFRELARAQG